MRTSILALGLGLWLAIVAVSFSPSVYAPIHLVALGLIYGLLAATVSAGGRFLSALLGPLGTASASMLVGLVAIFHLREQTRWPTSFATVVGLGLLVAPVVWPLVRAPRDDGWRRPLVGTLIAGALFATTLVAAFAVSPVFRWHLLRHNTMLGTPAYYLLATPVEDRLAELWAKHGLELTPSDEPVAPSGPPSGESAEGAALPTSDRPHVVFVLLDTLRADALSPWGGDPGQMPNLEARLESAWRFTDVWANASWTRPSIASFFTGLTPEAHGARLPHEGLGGEHVTMAEALRERGYATTAFVANVAAVGANAGFGQGFDLYRELLLDPYARAGAVREAVDGWVGSETFDPGGPHFVYVHLLDPHEPYLAGDPPSVEQPDAYRTAYRRELAYLDRELEPLLARLESALEGPTVLVVASDHGEEFFEHGLFGHGFSLYEEVIRVPVAVWTPDGPGAAAHAELEGRDLFDLVLGLTDGAIPHVGAWATARSRETRTSSIYYSTTGRLVLRPYQRQIVMRAIQVGDEKVIWSAYGDTLERYDLADDPGETINLTARDSARSAELAALLDQETPSWTPGGPIELTPEALDQLRALGYVD